MDLAAVLRPDAALPSGMVDLSDVEAAAAHGIAPLLYRAFADRGELGALDPAVRGRLARLAREAAVVEDVRARDLAAVVGRLEADGIRPLLFKGAALAATHYPEPWLRTRGDTDLLVRAEEAWNAGRVLEAWGMRRLPRPSGPLVTQQARYGGTRGGVPLAYDLHWRIVDPHAFADALPYDELEAHAVTDHPSGARRLSNVHALATACVHRAAHHYDTTNLLLVWDIHLLATGLTSAEWDRFAAFAARKRLRTLCGRALQLAASLFGTRVPPAVEGELAPDPDEPTAIYARPGLRKVDLLDADLHALPRWRDRVQLIWQHVFPGREYLRAQSGRPSHVGRLVTGAAKWFRPI